MKGEVVFIFTTLKKVEENEGIIVELWGELQKVKELINYER